MVTAGRVEVTRRAGRLATLRLTDTDGGGPKARPAGRSTHSTRSHRNV
ncbi:hypothetical protein BGLA2_720022 [Burkholderia gladioli]|nr:hypothetical protein BGLA2_720022 [Burkholderia gladioli]